MAPVENTRMKRYRDKIKEDPQKWQLHLEKERARDKKRRENVKKKLESHSKLKKEMCERIRNRVRKCREKKKLVPRQSTPQKSPIGSYTCLQSFGKAVNRLKKVLPESPNKKTAIIRKLAVEMGLVLKDKPQVKRVGPRALPEEHIQCVKEFFASDPISRQAPGKLDVKSVKCPKTGKRTNMQKRHMIMTIGEAYEEFQVSHPNVIVKKSAFFSLRPEHVLPVSKMPHNVCVCKYHSNINFLIESISKVGPTFPKDHKGLLEKLCCDTTKEDCMYENCSVCCKDKVSDMIESGIDFNKNICWKQWVDESGIIKLNILSGTVKEAVKELESKMSHFKKHCFVKKVQEQFFVNSISVLKENAEETYAVVQIDFAENYSILHQDEIQAAHWSHRQVAIFTCCVWLPDGGKKSYVVISDDTSHSKYCVSAFFDRIVEDVKSCFPKIDQLMIFSDNCAGQFKNKYTISTLCRMLDEYGLQLQWNFFSSSHGKGAVDGIGAIVKRHVWMSVKGNRDVHLATAKDFYDHVNTKLSVITSFYVDKTTVAEKESILNEYWSNVNKIPGIRECHHFRVYDSTHLLIARTSQSLMTKVPIMEEKESDEESLDERFLNLKANSKTRLHYADVYSDEEENESENVQASEPIDTSAIYSGLFILVKVPSEQSRGQKLKEGKIYRYAAICQSSVDNEGFLSVMFLKSQGNSKTVFIADNDDITDVKFENVVGKLQNPTVKPKGLFTILYEFPHRVDICEK